LDQARSGDRPGNARWRGRETRPQRVRLNGDFPCLFPCHGLVIM
jgi:hypothetical protein